VPERILVLATSYPRSPGDSSGHFVETEVEELRAQGHRVEVLVGGAPVPGKPLQSPHVQFLGGSSLFAAPGALQRLKEAPWRIVGLLEASARLLRTTYRQRYDRVIAHWALPSAFPWALAVRGTPTIEVVAHGSDIQLLLRLPAQLRTAFIHSLMKRRAKLRFVSHALKEDLLRGVRSPPIRDYLREAEVRPASLRCHAVPNREEARRKLRLEPKERIALIVGRLITEKRPETAIAAANLLPQCRLVIIGEGPLRPQLSQLAPDALFLGQLPREETLLWIRAADLLLGASRLEGAPTTIREARQLGTPVVSSNVGDLTTWATSDDELYVVD